MDASEFRKRGKEMVDFMADYLENIRERKVFSKADSEFFDSSIPGTAPQEPEDWEDIMKDVNNVILPGMTHLHSPHCHGWYPLSVSYPALCAEMLSTTLGPTVANRDDSPAHAEHEMKMMDWLANMADLPKKFHYSSRGKGGGLIQGTSSESMLCTLIAAKNQAVEKWRRTGMTNGDILSKLVAYSSDQAHSMTKKNCRLAAVTLREVRSNDACAMTGASLGAIIERDRTAGFLPFYVCATFGTTPTCAFDDVETVGRICRENDLWLHIDAAYAGNALVCEENRHLMRGIEFATSFNFNPYKWMLAPFGISALWYEDFSVVAETFAVSPIYLNYNNQAKNVDFKDLEIPLGRRFRSLDLWFILRLYGVSGIKKLVRKQMRLALIFKEKVLRDERFEIAFPTRLGLVCFRLKGSDQSNKTLEKIINKGATIHLTPGQTKSRFYLRFVVTSPMTTEEDIDVAWSVITKAVSELYSSALNRCK